MILNLRSLTFLHVAISLVGIASGFVVMYGLLTANDSTSGRRSFW